MPSAVPPSFGVCRTHRDRRLGWSPTVAIGAARYRWRSAPEPSGSTPWRSPFGPEAPGSIPCRRRSGSHQPPDLCADVATGTRPVHRPYSVAWRGWWQGGRTPSRAAVRGCCGWPRVVATTARDRQRRIARIRPIRPRPLAQHEPRSPARLDDPHLPTPSTQPRIDHVSGPSCARVANARIAVQASGALAERVGFEPTNPFESALFKSAAFNRSATSPSGQDTGAPPDGPSTRRSGLRRP